jgi:hypothetical protein
VTGDTALVEIRRNNVVVPGPAGDSGSRQDCTIGQPGWYVYEIAAENGAGSAAPRQETVNASDASVDPYPARLPSTG